MRKWVYFELGLLAFLLIFAVVVCICIPAGLFSSTVPGTPETNAMAATPEVTIPEETTPPTEPFVMPEITWRTLEADRELTCATAFVYDCTNQSYLFTLGDPDAQLYPASITKLMSIHVASQYLEPNWRLTAGSILDWIPEDASVAKLEKGDVCTVETLLEGMLLPSGNDAAYLIATQAGREIAKDQDLGVEDAIAVFVDEMNRQAQELGMTDTLFQNPDGWHNESHYTTFTDLLILAEVALENTYIQKYATVPKTTITPLVGEEKEWVNTNLLVNPETIYYCPYAIGLKTGQTDAAGSCLLSAFDIEGRRYIIGVFNSPEYLEKLDDTLQLLNEIVMTQP